MRIICVDDEPLIAERAARLCRTLREIDEAIPFTQAQPALRWLENNQADLALLDIDMPDMNGIDLAKTIKLRYPGMKIIFLTSYPQYAVDAFHLHVSGYLLKPLDPDELAQEVSLALSEPVREKPGQAAPVLGTASGKPVIRCFGPFEIYWQGVPLMFGRRKTKELLAFLVDRNGAACTAEEIADALWEGETDMSALKHLIRNLISDLKKTLTEIGMEGILVRRSGQVAIRRDLVDCDYYRMQDGDPAGINAFSGEYMTQYSWAEMTAGKLSYHIARDK